MRYISDIPKPDEVPPGQVVVHNHATPTRRLGTTAFRAWLADRANTPNIEPCDCNWAPELRGHYRENPTVLWGVVITDAARALVASMIEPKAKPKDAEIGRRPYRGISINMTFE